jgi:hypothetical protein
VLIELENLPAVPAGLGGRASLVTADESLIKHLLPNKVPSSAPGSSDSLKLFTREAYY